MVRFPLLFFPVPSDSFPPTEHTRFVRISPLNNFPAIKKLTLTQRKKYHIIGGEGFDFEDSDEVYHIADFIGNTAIEFSGTKDQSMINEPAADYKRTKKKKKVS